MDKQCFLDAGVPPNLRFNPTQMMPNWQSLTMEEPSCSPEKSHGFFRYPMDQHASYESALSSMVSSYPASNDNFAIRELIGKLGSNSAEMAQLPHPLMAGYMGGGSSSGGANTSSYSNSPPNPNLHFPIMDHFVKDNLPNLGNSPPPPPPLSADPGFAERAAKFSCFGSRSFNGRTSQLGLNSTESPYRSNNPLLGNVKLPRVSSSPSLEAARSPMGARENQNSTQTHMEIRSTTVSETRFATSNDGSSVSGQTPNAGGETGMRISGDSNPRKRKGKSSVNSTKVQETGDDDPNNKRAKSIEGNGNENDSSGTEEKSGQKQGKAKSKPSEPPKDYIHVRARRGQATDSHSLAERVRREKISERMKFLQDLVPGCNKVTGKALMLDEIINYVKSLQHRVEHLSMKLASVDPRDISIDSLLSKHAFDQADGSSSCMALQMNPMETDFFGHHQSGEIPQLHTKGSVSQCSMDPMDCRSSGIMQLPSVDDFGQSLAEFPGLCEGELQSIVQMGFGHNSILPNQTSHMKIEL